MTDNQFSSAVWTAIAFIALNFAALITAASFGTNYLDRLFMDTALILCIEAVLFFVSLVIVFTFNQEGK